MWPATSKWCTSARGLVLPSADRHALPVAQQECADSTMGYDCYVCIRSDQGDGLVHRFGDPALSVDGSLPPPHTFPGHAKKLSATLPNSTRC
jgi:hypothetical protein